MFYYILWLFSKQIRKQEKWANYRIEGDSATDSFFSDRLAHIKKIAIRHSPIKHLFLASLSSMTTLLSGAHPAYVVCAFMVSFVPMFLLDSVQRTIDQLRGISGDLPVASYIVGQGELATMNVSHLDKRYAKLDDTSDSR